MSALELERVSHSFGDLLAVDDFSLAVEEGEIVCLLGPSGCGKTTILRLAAGLEQLQGGTISLAGETVADGSRHLPPEARSVGLVFQDYALFPHLSVMENVTFGLRGGGLRGGGLRGGGLGGRGAKDREARGLEVLDRVGMAGSAGVFPHTLSGGQQQRVALARALAPEPKVLLLDEPFSGLDSQLRNRVRDHTLHILKASGTSSLMVTHDPEEAMFMADRIVLLRQGRIAQCGEPESLYRRPANAFVAGFFGEINRLEGVVSDSRVATPLGAVAAGSLPESTPVEILIRPEALRLRLVEAGGADEARGAGGTGNAANGRGLARVLASRMLGRTSLVHLSVPGRDRESGLEREGDGQEPSGPGRDGSGAVHLHARVPGAFLPAEDSIMEIELDPSQVFVFPLDKAV